jgi:N6-adenosine-specific RNA methylase IME4
LGWECEDDLDGASISEGKMPCPEPKARPESVISAKRGRHSEKPYDVYRIIEKAYPTLKKFELFARKDHDRIGTGIQGWKRW